VFVLKQTLARLRPSELVRSGEYGFAAPFSGEPFTSLPSSHCFTAFAMAAVLSRLQPELRAVFFGAAMLVVAAVVAVSFHRLVVRVLRRLGGDRHAFLGMLVARAVGPTRLALVVFASSVTLQLAPFEPYTAAVIARVLTALFVVLLGWVALTALDVAAMLHLRRFRIDVEDNLLARKHVTQTRILRRGAALLIIIVTLAAALMTFEPVRQYGVSLLAAGGAAGIIVGLAAQPILSNLFAGLQLAVTQPIRIDDAVIVEGEWGTVEEISATYVVVKIWDWRRLVVPLRYFIEQPFQNWTRETASLIGVVMLYVDYRAPVDKIRAKLEEIAAANPRWDGEVVNLQVVDATETTMQLRALVSARNAPTAWDLRCDVREALIAFLQSEHPEALPLRRAAVEAPSGFLQPSADAAETANRAVGPVERPVS
ncbi:MAG: mechanosensitive ion channel domain-containing protein, partial [Alphaproteobacteria bacterium]